MMPHTKTVWLDSGNDACLECSSDWPCPTMRAFQAGYRAAMRDVNGLFEELDQSGESYKKMWATMGAWLDEQVKKEGA